MRELCSTDDIVLKSYIEALLKDADIQYFVADESMQAMYPNMGIWSHRIYVSEEDLPSAIALLKDAEIERSL